MDKYDAQANGFTLLEENDNKKEVSKGDSEKNIRLSVNKNFAKEYDAWDKDKIGFAFNVGTTSEPLMLIGVDSKDIWWDASKIKAILKKHPDMTNDIIKQVPNVLEEPIVIMKSKTVQGRVTLFGNLYDKKGSPVLVALELNPQVNGGNSLDVIKVASAYGKDIKLQNFINTSEILYVKPDKKIVHNWLSVNRLKLPLPSSQYGLIKKINESSSKSNIQQTNTKSQQENAKKVEEEERFSLKAPVEETKDLIAVHNLSESTLLKQIKDLGGFPSPSIAITKAKLGHTSFGNVSVLFGRDTVDPARRDNAVYSSDAYTPTVPPTEYKANEKVAHKLHNLFYSLEKKYGRNRVGVLYGLGNYAEDELNRKGLDKIEEELKANTMLKEVFLLEKGINLPDVKKTEELVYKPADDEKTAKQYFAYEMLKERFADYKNLQSLDEKVDYMYKHFDEIKETIEKAGVDTSDYKIRNYKFMLSNAFYFDPKETRVVEDRSERDAFIKANAEKEGYTAWIDDLLNGLVEKKGLYNGKDYYTNSGNKRSFESTHYEYTLENIVRAMYDTTQEQGKGFGGNSLIGSSAKKYESISDIKGDRDRLRKIDEDEYIKLRKDYRAKLNEITDSFAMNYNPDDISTWHNHDAAADLLLEAIMQRKTKEGVASYLQKEGKGWTRYSEQVVNDLWDLIQEVRTLPSGYFEAKPRRAVYSNEIKGVIMPENADAGLKDALGKLGIEYKTYEMDNDEDRIKVTNELAQEKNIIFSLKSDQDWLDTGFNGNGYHVLERNEWAKFNSIVMKNNQQDNLRIGDTGALIPTEDAYTYKLVSYYMDSEDNPVVNSVYLLENYDYNIHDDEPNMAQANRHNQEPEEDRNA